MNLNGKKTAKMHVRLTEDVAREVRAAADLECRPIQDQIRVLIIIGLQVFRQGNMGDSRRTMPHVDAQDISPVPPRAAPRRMVTRKEGAA